MKGTVDLHVGLPDTLDLQPQTFIAYCANTAPRWITKLRGMAQFPVFAFQCLNAFAFGRSHAFTLADRSFRLTHPSSVWLVQPILAAMDSIAAHCRVRRIFSEQHNVGTLVSARAETVHECSRCPAITMRHLEGRAP